MTFARGDEPMDDAAEALAKLRQAVEDSRALEKMRRITPHASVTTRAAGAAWPVLMVRLCMTLPGDRRLSNELAFPPGEVLGARDLGGMIGRRLDAAILDMIQVAMRSAAKEPAGVGG